MLQPNHRHQHLKELRSKPNQCHSKTQGHNHKNCRSRNNRRRSLCRRNKTQPLHHHSKTRSPSEHPSPPRQKPLERRPTKGNRSRAQPTSTKEDHLRKQRTARSLPVLTRSSPRRRRGRNPGRRSQARQLPNPRERESG